MGLRYPPPLFVNILFPILAVGLLIITYFTLGVKYLSSNLFTVGVYAFIVPILFFTYGGYVEKRVAKNELDRFIKNNLDLFKFLMSPTAPPSVPQDADVGDNPADAETKKTNQELIKYSLIATAVIMVLFVSISYGLWNNNRKFSYKRMMIQNGIVLTLVVAVEIIFTTLIAGNYRQLDSNRIKEELFRQLLEYGTACPP